MADIVKKRILKKCKMLKCYLFFIMSVEVCKFVARSDF